MKTKIQLLILTTFTILLISCSRNINDVEGTYYNTNTDKEFSTNIDKIRLKDGYTYNEENGKRFKYKIEDDKIIVGNYGMQIIFKIIDNETIQFAGDEFNPTCSN